MRTLSEIVLNSRHPILTSTQTVLEASQTMQKLRVDSVLVTDKTGRLEGIVTGSDVCSRVLEAGKDPHSTILDEIMTTEPVAIAPERDANEALQLMWDCGFRHLPVLDANRVIGVVSQDDFNDTEKARHEDEREFWEQMR